MASEIVPRQGKFHEPMRKKYVVELRGVREVTLRGWAELEYWQRRLTQEELFPVANEGRAELLISAVASRFLGIPFRELSVSVFVSQEPKAVSADGLYLVQAFNSLRWFAAMERLLYRTPYDPAGIEVSTELPLAMRLHRADETWLAARMNAKVGRAGTSLGADDWEGTIYLPKRRGRCEKFFARLAGETTSFTFDATDRIELRPVEGCAVARLLSDSQFAGTEWLVRPVATHARSKTFAR